MNLLLRTHASLAVDSLKRTRVRTLLTSLGIAIGVAAIVLILSLSGSIQNLISNQIKSIGSDLIVVRPASSKDTASNLIDELTSATNYKKSPLLLSDVEIINNLQDVTAVAPLAISEDNLLVSDKIYTGVNIVASTPDLNQILALNIKSGQFLSTSIPNDATIGFELAMSLFGTADCIGRSVKYHDQVLLITGVLEQSSDPINFNNIDFDKSLIIPVSFALAHVDLQIQQINIKVKNSDAISPAVGNITDTLKTQKNGAENFVVLSGSEISHPASSLFGIVSAMLTVVAGVSLIVGGIGVMNIMLVSVAERTREIGIRKAVGASSTNILLQFLFESLILSLLGGIVGLFLGYCLTFIVALFTPFPPFISLEIFLITLCTSLFIGLLFGLLPALKAAHKNPIDSLKFYR
jgi:ABC-type antimicrobial peptide transport system permease subunit